MIALLVTSASIASVPGPFALAAVLATHLLLCCAVLGVIGFAMDRSRRSGVATVVLLVLVFNALGFEWLSLPPATVAGRPIAVTSWNLEVGSGTTSTLTDVIASHGADLVALQELTPEAAGALEADPRIQRRYPHRYLVPETNVLGLGILSAIPIIAHATTADPLTMTVQLDLGSGQSAYIVNAHPLPGDITTVTTFRLPVGFDPRERDASLRAVRETADDLLSTGLPVIVLGDFNVAPTEPAYRALAAGMHDVHSEVGIGPGWTWRPDRLRATRLGLLRIDYVFTSQAASPDEIHVDCSHAGDHCVVHARVIVHDT